MTTSFDQVYIEFGNNLRRFRNSKKLSQEDFGSKLDLSRVSITNIEKGRQKPTIHLIFNILLTFNAKMEDIFPFDLLEQIKAEKRIKANKPHVAKFLEELNS
ncbi:DNA-binding transcriptional regulator, XRE-family HTH domain [Marivirga sericea]|uniref:DNA-binding transcriptional regulator, XRE-family HTH domain n=1 Tax=Marivirga sericea TaxID=1028 RepID=A0A1X7KMC3_9BACT|nr:helix-turn-helix domain-containing protein [Marivirga sericea]SMG42674.1 DNA-binding transcriptional regulator, XRE-family HTH domain [Marivirga sericea]